MANYIETSTLTIGDNSYELVDDKGRSDLEQAQILTDTALNNIIEGKKLLADAISYKKVATQPTDSFQVMSDNIRTIKTGINENLGTGYRIILGSQTFSSDLFEIRNPWFIANRAVMAGNSVGWVTHDMPERIRTDSEQDWHVITRAKITDNAGIKYILGTRGHGYGTQGFRFALYVNKDVRDKATFSYYGAPYPEAQHTVELNIPQELREIDDLVWDLHYVHNPDGDVSNFEIKVLNPNIDEVVWVSLYKDALKFSTDYNGEKGTLAFGAGDPYMTSDISMSPLQINVSETAFVVNGIIQWGNSSYYTYPESSEN